jgi:hypothetical protein
MEGQQGRGRDAPGRESDVSESARHSLCDVGRRLDFMFNLGTEAGRKGIIFALGKLGDAEENAEGGAMVKGGKNGGVGVL